MRAIQAAAGDAPSVAAKATTNTDNFRRLVAAGLHILTALTVFRAA
jgi:hypothetical protein